MVEALGITKIDVTKEDLVKGKAKPWKNNGMCCPILIKKIEGEEEK